MFGRQNEHKPEKGERRRDIEREKEEQRNSTGQRVGGDLSDL